MIADAGASPAYLAKAIAHGAGLRSPADRPGTSRRARAAALAALVGGPAATRIRGFETSGALVDGTAAYPVVASSLGTSSWAHAERIEQHHVKPGRGLATLVGALDAVDADRLLDEPELWRSLAGEALVHPDGDLLAVRGRLLGGLEDHTGTLPVAAGSDPVWCGLPRVVASKLLTGRLPRIAEAYTLHPVGVFAGARATPVLGRIVFDPHLDRVRRGQRIRDLSTAITEVGLLAKTEGLEGLDPLTSRRVAGAAKSARNVAAYGGLVEFNQSARAHPAWGTDGKLGRSLHEEPGWLTDPVAGSLVVSGCELLITLLEVLVHEAGGSTVFVDTDAAYIPMSPGDGPIEIGAVGDVHPHIGAIRPTELVHILNRFGPLARSTGLSIPTQHVRLPTGEAFAIRSVFKLTDENLAQDGMWAQTTCRAVAKKRYVIGQMGPNGEKTSVKSSAHVLGTLANFRSEGQLDEQRITEAWQTGPNLVAGGPITTEWIDLEESVLQEFTAAHPRDWRALRRLCFSSANPDGIRPFEALLVPLPLGTPRARLVAPYEPDRTRWGTLTFRDADANFWSVRTPERIGGFAAESGSRIQVVPSIRGWLTGYFRSPEPLALGPDGRPCTEGTIGPLKPITIRITRRRLTGQEPHRRRDEEAVLGWDVQIGQAEASRTCLAPGCDAELVRRERRWCERHKKYPGTRRRAWAQGRSH